jgi:hypothetical protein
MIRSTSWHVTLALCGVLTLFAGCSSQQDAASRVIADAEATLQSLQDEAQRLAPEQYAAAEQSIARLRERFAERDYAGILAALPAVTTELTELQQLAARRRAELEAALERARLEWDGMSVELPAKLNALQARIDELAQLRQLPAGIDRRLIERARAQLESIKAAWAEALAAFAQGRLPEAADRARESRERAEQLQAELGLQSA